MRRGRLAGRLAAMLALVAIATAVLLIGGRGDGYQVTAEFQNAAQIVGGELVVVGGVRGGSVEKIELADDGRARITFSIDENLAPLPEGTTATIRSPALAQIAGRQVELILPDEPSEGSIADGGTIDQTRTVTAVDLDQFFNMLDDEAVRGLKRVLQGLEAAYAGVGKKANRGLKFLNPLLSTSREVVGELRRDSSQLEQLIVDTSQLSGALAERAPEISELVRNLSVATRAIGRQREALSEGVSTLPNFLRGSKGTLANLRGALDDLDPVLEAADPVADRLGPFFRAFRRAADGAVPTIRDLDATVRRPGAANDLVALLRRIPRLAAAGVGSGGPECGEDPTSDVATAADGDFNQGALGEATCALRNSLPILAHFRPYTPELIGWFDDFGYSGTLDANGGIGRISTTFNAFSLSPSNGLPELLSPIDPADLFGAGERGAPLSVGNNARCPGANERDPGDGSVPFTDRGRLNCDPSQVPVGP